MGLGAGKGSQAQGAPISVLIDTHILLWILSGSRRLRGLLWLKDYPYWTVSPISLLEMKFLQESDRISIDLPAILNKLRQDARFKIDNVPFEDLCLAAIDISWTRDPFDRFLVAHSVVRSLPIGTCDEMIRQKYSLVI